MPTNIANIKITSNDIIKNWWKLNRLDSDIAKDSGEGDVDFYTYWYSICYVAAMVNVYRRIFRDVETYEAVVYRFLQSREVAFKQDSTFATLLYIYDNYINEFKKRGTVVVNDFEGQSKEIGESGYVNSGTILTDIAYNAGIGVINDSIDLEGVLDAVIDLGLYHSIQFDALFLDENGDPYDVGGSNIGRMFIGTTSRIVLLKGIGTAYTFTYRCGGIDYTFTTNVDPTVLNTVKFVRYGTLISLYINDLLIGSTTITSNVAFTFGRLFTSALPAVANIVTKKMDITNATLNVYSWICNEGSGFALQSNQAPNYAAVLNVTADTFWSLVWRRSELFVNTDYVGIDGELRRLINYINGECLLELISTTELGLVLDISSFTSQEANCVNLNKAYQKGIITNLSKFPLTFDDIIKPSIVSGYIKYTLPTNNVNWYGLNTKLLTTPEWKTVVDYKPLGQIPFLPIEVATDPDNMDGYEISFILRSTAAIKLKFGLATYDVDMDHLVGLTKNHTTDAVSDMFLDDSNFTFGVNQEIWIRGVYSLKKLNNLSNAPYIYLDSALNIGLGNNLYNDSQDTVKFIVPIISFMAIGTGAVDVSIKDIVVRPLSLPTEKGVVGNKNSMIGFIKNLSGGSDASVSKFIEEKLIPYNCSATIQYL